MTTRTPARPHPLAEHADRIDTAAQYTVTAIAELVGMSVSSVGMMAGYGWLPGAKTRPRPGGGRERVWTGAALARLASRRIRIEYDHERYDGSTLYRAGCRCEPCTRAHNDDSRLFRQEAADRAFDAEQRERLLALVAAGSPVPEAAREVSVSPAQVYGRATRDAAFARALDEAGAALCVLGRDDPRCGTPTAYRGQTWGEDRRPGCRGTACREWRRESARRERQA